MRKMLEREKQKFVELYSKYQSALDDERIADNSVKQAQEMKKRQDEIIWLKYIILCVLIVACEVIFSDFSSIGAISAYAISGNIGYLNYSLYKAKQSVKKTEAEYEDKKAQVEQIYERLCESHDYLCTITDILETSELLAIDNSDILSYIEPFENVAYVKGDTVKKLGYVRKEN